MKQGHTEVNFDRNREQCKHTVWLIQWPQGNRALGEINSLI